MDVILPPPALKLSPLTCLLCLSSEVCGLPGRPVAPFTILDGAIAETTADRNQQTGPNDEEAAGVWWESLGTFSIESGILTVQLSDPATAGRTGS